MSDEMVRLVDFALLHPMLTDAELRAGCEKAEALGVASICIKPYAVKMAADLLSGSSVAVGTVIGFPHGSPCSAIKAEEARQACRDGATELDMVINVGKAIGGDWSYVRQDIRAVHEVAKEFGAKLKVIFENDYIKDDEVKITLCQVCTELGVDFVKTSTGFGYVKQPDGQLNTKGATIADLTLMRKHSGPQVQVKAAGGIRDYATAKKMHELGVTRFGTSSPEALRADVQTQNSGY
jgi:deoxyribose-phosphate aldolase